MFVMSISPITLYAPTRPKTFSEPEYRNIGSSRPFRPLSTRATVCNTTFSCTCVDIP